MFDEQDQQEIKLRVRKIMTQATDRRKEDALADKPTSEDPKAPDQVHPTRRISDKPQVPADPEFDQGNRSTSSESLEEWSPGADVPKT